MKLEVFSRPFFTNYIVHPRSSELDKHNKRKALISSIAIGILTLGICHAFCAIKFHGKRTQLDMLRFLKDTTTPLDQMLEQAQKIKATPLERLQMISALSARGHLPAMTELGLLYCEGGEGIGKVDVAGLALLNQAADAGDIRACKELCKILAHTQPIVEDTKTEILKRAEQIFVAGESLVIDSVSISNRQELEDFLSHCEESSEYSFS